MSEPSAGLYWPIKRSFVLYVARIADGDILGGPGIRMADASTFVWSWGPQETDAVLAFTGAVVFRAHAGALSFRVADPHVHLGADRATLTIAGESGRLPMVTFTAEPEEAAEGQQAWRGREVRLADQALALFAGYYGADEPFDDLRLVVPAAR